MADSKTFDEVVDLIITSTNLRHVDPKAISKTTTLGPAGLGLDSIDILEVVVNVELKFGVKIDDRETGETAFQSVGTITDFIESARSAGAP
jgi:acyl carrier protein